MQRGCCAIQDLSVGPSPARLRLRDLSHLGEATMRQDRSMAESLKGTPGIRKDI
jgi:hypothetical protein